MRKTSIDREIESAKKRVKCSKKENKKTKKWKSLFSFIFMLCTVCCFIGIGLLYGPYNGFRDWLITTAQTTMTHKYFATWFFDNATINDCMNRNTIIQVSGTTDVSAIKFSSDNKLDMNITYENEYEEAVLKKDAKNNDYKIIKINGDKYSGYLAVIYDASRVKTVATSDIGKSGEYLTSMAKKNNALVAINAGGFADENYEGTGGTPLGITISKGKYLTEYSYNGSGGLIGFNKDNVLMLGSFSVSQTKAQDIRDGVTFGPFLIINGKASEIAGNGGWGRADRKSVV